MQANLFSKYSYSEKVLSHSEYEYIYISPHLDDVPLSCSGTICQQRAQGLNILVVTVFAGEPQPPFSPFAQGIHRTWQAPEEAPYQVRKAEERKAMTVLDVDYWWLDWLEVLYRAPQPSDLLELFGEPNDDSIPPQDAPLFARLRNWLADLRLAYPRAQIVAPLSLGWHRDHRLVFQASLNVIDPHHLLFFEDFPYGTYYQPEELTKFVEPYHLFPIEVDISACLQQRIAAAECYQSQLPTFYHSAPSFPDLIREYTSMHSGQQRFVERYWKLPQ